MKTLQKRIQEACTCSGAETGCEHSYWCPQAESLFDVDGKPYVHGDRMSKRQYYSHGGPGWDSRFWQTEYNSDTDEVDNDDPYPSKKE